MTEELTSLIGKSTKSLGMYLPVPAFSINILLLCFPHIQVGLEMAAVPVMFFSPWEIVIRFAAVQRSQARLWFFFFNATAQHIFDGV